MSTYVLMKILESSPSRYDRGIRMLTFGTVEKAYDRLVENVKAGQRVLDIGCGTGALTVRAALKQAQIQAIDINPQMMTIARQRVEQAGATGRVTFCEQSVVELDSEPAANYDVVMSGLCFSELSDDELCFGLGQVYRILKPGGILLLADEVRPDHPLKRLFYWLMRLPMVIITWLLTQTSTRAISHLPAKVAAAGFQIDSVRLNRTSSFIELVAHKHEGNNQ